MKCWQYWTLTALHYTKMVWEMNLLIRRIYLNSIEIFQKTTIVFSATLYRMNINLWRKSITLSSFFEARRNNRKAWYSGTLPSCPTCSARAFPSLSKEDELYMTVDCVLQIPERKIYNYYYNNNKIWILFAMCAYSFDEPKFTSAQEKKKKKKQ